MEKVCPIGKRILLIINPKAGRRKSISTLSSILDVFAQNSCKVVSFSTKGKNDATELVKKHGEDYDVVVCCGGDGTLNEVINGVMHLKKSLPIGYIPMGTSNDFATSLGLSIDIEQAAQDIVDGALLPHDVGSLNDEYYFSYVASFGTISDVSFLTSQKMKNLFGHLAYKIEGSKVLFRMHAHHVKVSFDDRVIEGDFLLGGASNSKSMGGLIQFKNKNIILNDGIFELMFFRKPTNAKDVGNIIKWLATQNDDNPSVLIVKTAAAVFTSDTFIPWTVDGEFAGHHKVVHITNKHNAVSFLCPKK